MPTFDEIERSEDAGVPITLVRIVVGTEEFLYTDHEQDFAFNDKLYSAVPLKTGAVEHDVMLEGSDLPVTLPRSEPLFNSFWPTMTRLPTTLEVRQTHEGASDAPFVFSGSVFSAALDEDRISFSVTAKDGLYQINKVGSRRKWQAGCPFLIYGEKCKASEAVSKFEGKAFITSSGFSVRFESPEINRFVATNATGTAGEYWTRNLKVGEFGAGAARLISSNLMHFWMGSRLVIGGVTFSRGIYKVATNVSFPVFEFYEAEDMASLNALASLAGVPATLIPDCTRTIDCCRGIHGNNLNYGGQTNMPYKSPINTSYIGER